MRVDVTSVLEVGMRVRIQRNVNNVTGFFQCTVHARRQMAFSPTPKKVVANQGNASATADVAVAGTESGDDDGGDVTVESTGDDDDADDDAAGSEVQYCYDVILGSGKKVEKVSRSFLRLLISISLLVTVHALF